MRTISFNFSTFFLSFCIVHWGEGSDILLLTTDNRIVFMVTESFMWIVIHWLIKPSPYVNCDWLIDWLNRVVYVNCDWLINCTESFMWIVFDWLNRVVYANCDWLINCTESFMWIVIDWLYRVVYVIDWLCVILRHVQEYFTNQGILAFPVKGALTRRLWSFSTLSCHTGSARRCWFTGSYLEDRLG